MHTKAHAQTQQHKSVCIHKHLPHTLTHKYIYTHIDRQTHRHTPPKKTHTDTHKQTNINEFKHGHTDIDRNTQSGKNRQTQKHTGTEKKIQTLTHT